MATVDNHPDPQNRARLCLTLSGLLSDIVSDTGPQLPFTQPDAHIWQALLYDPALSRVSQLDRLVYATAISHNLAVAEEARAEHFALQSLGVVTL